MKEDYTHQLALLRSSRLFDAGWYEQRYRDVSLVGISPAEHYLRIGARLMRDPGPDFSTSYYLKRYHDVFDAGLNPLIHFIEHGSREGRDTKEFQLEAAQIRQKVDIVVPVFNAILDTEACLRSIDKHKDGYDVQVFIINDGSDPEPSRWLAEFCESTDGFHLIDHEGNRGYTAAVNTGIRNSSGPYLVILNSDTVVSRGWLMGMMRCMGSGQNVGIVGPLSNAASWQNVPTLLDATGAFAVNQLPDGMTIAGMARIVASASIRNYPRVPFLNGFCYMIRREVIDTVGLLDEANFPIGYGEENDYCVRAGAAGFELAIADDTFVYHAKSKSFGHERRQELSRKGSQALHKKHTEEKVRELVRQIKANPQLADIRERVRHAIASVADYGQLNPLQTRILFVLPVKGGGGGAHSVVQEVAAMRRIGVDAKIAVRRKDHEDFCKLYSNLKDFRHALVEFDGERIDDIVDGYDVVVATIYSSMAILARSLKDHPHILPAYYVQDYEPLFFKEGTAQWQEAKDSYELLPSALLFAKTHWLVNRVRDEHGVCVEKVEPSIDHSVYVPSARDRSGQIVIAAMIRPQTPRRGADRTMRILEKIWHENPNLVSVHTFGCDQRAIEGLAQDFPFTNHGVLKREQVASVLDAADVFIDLSDYQAFGRTALEAMACGCAVGVPIYGGADEYAVDEVNAVVLDVFDEADCARRISSMVRDPDRMRRMQNAALETAAKYSIHRAAISELTLFSRRLARHRQVYPVPYKPSLVLIPSARRDAVSPSGSAWVRCLLPYRTERVRQHWSVMSGSRSQLPAPGSADVVLIQRDAGHIPGSILDSWLREWKRKGGKLIYEVDDDLLDTQGLYERGRRENLERLAHEVEMLASSADLIIVSTSSLAKRFGTFGPPVVTVPNALDAQLWRLSTEREQGVSLGQRDGRIRIGYVGTPTHDADLASISTAMSRIQDEYGEQVEIEVIGGFEHATPSFGKRVGLPRRNDYPSFVDWLFRRANWDIGILPLVDDRFNASKSYLKFLEYSALGFATVCSDAEAYRDVARHGVNCLVAGQRDEDWYQAVRRLVEDQDLRAGLAREARSMVANAHTTDELADLLLDTLSRLRPTTIDSVERSTS